MENGQRSIEQSYNAEGVMDDDLLVKRSKQGDMTSYGRLVEKYQDRLFNVIIRMVRNRDDALELTQEAFFKALKGLKTFRQSSSFYTWLFRIGYNVTISHCQRRQRLRWSSLPDQTDVTGRQADGLSQLADPDGQSPADRAELAESHSRVLAALDELEDSAKAVVVLRDIEQLDYAQIAKIMDVPIGTVKSRLFRARMVLREMLIDKDQNK